MGKCNMFKTIARQCDLQALTDAIVSQGLKEAIATSDPITVFGPTDCAFEKFANSKQCCPCGDLTQILLYHVVPQYLPSCQLKNDTLYDTLRQDDGVTRKVRVNVYSKPFRNTIAVNGVEVVEADIKASNGVLHKIDKVLCPPCGTIYGNLQKLPEFSLLVTAIQTAGLVDALNNPESSLTLFAPDNQAFEKLLEETGLTLEELLNSPELANILLYHVLGQTVFTVAIREGYTCHLATLLDGKTIDLKRRCGCIKVIDEVERKSKVIGKNLVSDGGVIHKISEVLLPFSL